MIISNVERLQQIKDYIEHTSLSSLAGEDLNDFRCGAEYNFEAAHRAEYEMIEAVIQIAQCGVIAADEPGAVLLYELSIAESEEVDITEEDWLGSTWTRCHDALNEAAS
jgi:hypothetical protein